MHDVFIGIKKTQLVPFLLTWIHRESGLNRVSSVELSDVFSVEKMSVEKNMTLNSTINNTKFIKKQCFTPIITSFDAPYLDFC